MNLILDTHVFLWFISGDKQLPDKVLEKIIDKKNKCYVSIASIWEIVIKLSMDKLEIKGGFDTVENFLKDNDFKILPIDLDDTKRLLKLKWIHRDPFDRIIIAQSQSTKSTIISKDRYFKKYGVKVLW